jgi:zinc transport system permease protein
MIIPNAAAQQVSRSFAGAMQLAVLLGISPPWAASRPASMPKPLPAERLCSSRWRSISSLRWARAGGASRHGTRAERHTHEHGPGCGHEAIPHGDHVDYLHDGHRHAPHDDHYDEHAEDHRHEPEHEYARRRVR